MITRREYNALVRGFADAFNANQNADREMDAGILVAINSVGAALFDLDGDTGFDLPSFRKQIYDTVYAKAAS